MSELFTVNPADFTIDELESAARGESPRLPAAMAVVVLRAKLDHQAAVQRLLRMAETSEFDLRARETAVQELSEIADTRAQLQQLTQSADARIASLARQALGS